MKRNLKIISTIGILVTAGAASAVWFLQNKNDKNILMSAKLNGNNELNVNKSKNLVTDFPVVTIQKTGDDKDKIIWLFLAEGYTKEQQDQFINDVDIRVKKMMEYEPFKSYSKEINVYAMKTESKSGGFSTKEKKDVFFGTEFHKSRNAVSISKKGKIVLEQLKKQFQVNYLKNGSIFQTFILLNSKENIELSTKEFVINSLGMDDSARNLICNSVKSFANISEENVDIYSNEKVNVSKYSDPNKMSWKDFLGFRGINVIKSNDFYIPSQRCVMRSRQNSYSFCEVCKLEIVKKLNNNTRQREDLYIAKPSITEVHEWDKLVVDLAEYQNQIQIKNSNLEFRTIIYNLGDELKKVKLELNIKGEVIFKEFDILPNTLKSCSLFKNNVNLEKTDSFFGRVIDINSDEELYNTKSGKKYSKIKINYKNKNTNKLVNEIKSTSFYVENGKFLDIKAPEIQGYEFSHSNKEDNKVLVNEELEIDYYYVEKENREITLKVMDWENKNIIKSKNQKIYKDQVFIPSIFDFVSDEKSIIVPFNKNIKYNDLEIKEIKYMQIIKSWAIYAKDMILQKGEVFVPNKDVKVYEWNELSNSYEFHEYATSLLTIKNNVNSQIVGDYECVFEFGPNNITEDKIKKKIKVKVVDSNKSSTDFESEFLVDFINTNNTKVETDYFEIQWLKKNLCFNNELIVEANDNNYKIILDAQNEWKKLEKKQKKQINKFLIDNNDLTFDELLSSANNINNKKITAVTLASTKISNQSKTDKVWKILTIILSLLLATCILSVLLSVVIRRRGKSK